MAVKKGKAKPMFRLYEDGYGDLIVEMPYFKDRTKTCGQCGNLNEWEYCENIGMGFTEDTDLDTFRACEEFVPKKGGR